jgi:hypothetical protein
LAGVKYSSERRSKYESTINTYLGHRGPIAHRNSTGDQIAQVIVRIFDGCFIMTVWQLRAPKKSTTCNQSIQQIPCKNKIARV